MADPAVQLSSGNQSVKTVAEFGEGKVGKARRWKAELQASHQARDRWIARSEKVVRRYEDARSATEESARKFNILWSNVQVIKPAVYAKPPKPEVSRRFYQGGSISRVAALIMERNLDTFVCEHSLFDRVLNAAVLDRLLPGQGTAWVRYDASLPPPPEPHDEPAADAPGAEYAAHEATETPLQEAGEHANQQITDDAYVGATGETVCYDYVHWKDFRCSVARVWEEVSWVGRRVYMTKAQGEKRFGEIFTKVPLNYKPDERQKGESTNKEFGPGAAVFDKAAIWEIWDKDSMTVVWLCEDFDQILDEQRDILELDDFFPCPKPLLATTTTDSIIPIPDYIMYQDQAAEIDLATNRISLLMQALKVVGVYDKKEDSLQRMLTEGMDNVMIPVDNWAMYAERGGIKGTVDFFPIDMVGQVLTQLIQDRNVLKQDVYEITGIADIVRGASVASETATAQTIKEKFAGIRINDTQKDIARFAADLLNMSAQIITNFFQPETLAINADIPQEDPDFQYLGPAIALIKAKRLIQHRIEVSVDAITEADAEKEKQGRVEFLTALGQFFQQASAAVEAHPEMATMMGHIVLWGVKGFKVGRDIEGVIEQGIKTIAQNPQPPKPNPEEEKGKLEMAKMQGEMAMDQQKAKDDMALAQQQLTMERERSQMEIQNEREMNAAKLDFMRQEFDLKLQFMREEMQMKLGIKQQEGAIKLQTAQTDAVVKQQTAEQDMALQAQQGEQDAALAQQAGEQQLEQQAEAHDATMEQQESMAKQKAEGER